MRNIMVLFFLVLAPLAVHTDGNASELSCGGRIISIGDTGADLVMKCGAPDWKDSHTEEIIDRPEADVKRKTVITVEEWTYNFGPQQFMRIVTLRNGRIADIRLGGYGHSKESGPERAECSDRIISVGDSKADVLIKCGEPFWKDVRQEELKEKSEDAGERKVFVTIEEWTYNLGSNRFMRIFTFRNGKVTDTRTGGYGFEGERK